MIVRRAVPADAESLLDLIRTMGAEVGLARFDDNEALNCIGNTLRNGIVFLAITDDGRLTGSIGLAISKWWYSTEQFLGDYWFYVSPEYRRSRAAHLLMGSGKRVSRVLCLPFFTGPVGRVDLERKAAFYLRLGLEPAGHSFWLEPR